MMTRPSIFRTAAALGGLAVILGAFGAHSLKGKISDELLDAWKIGVQYQFYHVFALLFISMVGIGKDRKWLVRASTLFLVGIILFSGSLYSLALLSLYGHELKFIGMLTPIGGLFFISGWISLFLSGKAT